MIKHTLTVERMIEIHDAIDLIGDGEFLDIKLVRRITKLKTSLSSLVKQVRKRNDRNFLMVQKLKNNREQYETELYRITAEKDNMLSLSEVVSVPTMTFSDFVAKEDRKQMFMDDKRQIHWREIKKDQLLVSQVFLSILGDLIEDDSNDEESKLIGVNKGIFEKMKELENTPTPIELKPEIKESENESNGEFRPE